MDPNVEQRPHELMDGKMNGLIDEWRTVEKKTGVINGPRMNVVAFLIQREPDCQTFKMTKSFPRYQVNAAANGSQ